MSLAKHVPESMLQHQDRASEYIKAEEAMKKQPIQSEGENNIEKMKGDQEYDVKDKYPRATKDSDSPLKKNNLGQRFTEYARLNARRSQILIDIKKNKTTMVEATKDWSQKAR